MKFKINFNEIYIIKFKIVISLLHPYFILFFIILFTFLFYIIFDTSILLDIISYLLRKHKHKYDCKYGGTHLQYD